MDSQATQGKPHTGSLAPFLLTIANIMKLPILLLLVATTSAFVPAPPARRATVVVWQQERTNEPSQQEPDAPKASDDQVARQTNQHLENTSPEDVVDKDVKKAKKKKETVKKDRIFDPMSLWTPHSHYF